jgi:opacity protein-like surface antigen
MWQWYPQRVRKKPSPLARCVTHRNWIALRALGGRLYFRDPSHITEHDATRKGSGEPDDGSRRALNLASTIADITGTRAGLFAHTCGEGNPRLSAHPSRAKAYGIGIPMGFTVCTTVFCISLCATHATAQSAHPAATGRTIDVSLGYSYMSRGDSLSNRVGLHGADASLTIGSSRLAIRADLGYVRAANVAGTGRHSDVLSYLAGPVFYPTNHRQVDTYVHALLGGAWVTGPVPRNGGFLLGGWVTGFAWAVGGGVDYWLTDSMALRMGGDYMRTAYFDNSLAIRGQNNIRATAAVVYFFGRRSRTRR